MLWNMCMCVYVYMIFQYIICAYLSIYNADICADDDICACVYMFTCVNI